LKESPVKIQNLLLIGFFFILRLLLRWIAGSKAGTSNTIRLATPEKNLGKKRLILIIQESSVPSTAPVVSRLDASSLYKFSRLTLFFWRRHFPARTESKAKTSWSTAGSASGILCAPAQVLPFSSERRQDRFTKQHTSKFGFRRKSQIGADH